MRKQRAVTLIEVLISIAVVAIGLLGVAALIPVAAYQTEQGARNDRKSNVGRRALREVRVRKLTDLEQLREWDPALPDPPFIEFNPASPLNPNVPRAFCVDPLGFALAEQGKTENGTSRAPAYTRFQTFGAEGFGGVTFPSLPRLTTNNFVMSNLLPPAVGPAAEEVFIFQDDVEFNLPDDVKLPPLQKYLKTSGTISKRDSRGRYSWMLMLTPEDNGYYTLSTVISADRRILAHPQTLPVTGWIRGASLQNVTVASANIDIPIGNWLMLARRGGLHAPPGVGTFRWYRVSSLANDAANGRTFLTLDGQPWNPPIPPVQPVYALLPTNVVAVYTRSIQFP